MHTGNINADSNPAALVNKRKINERGLSARRNQLQGAALCRCQKSRVNEDSLIFMVVKTGTA